MNITPDGNEELRRLLEAEVPELAAGVVQIKGMARERGVRALIAVSSTDPRVDPVGALAGERGARVKAVVRQLSGEYIDIVRWSASAEEFLSNAFAPRMLEGIAIDQTNRRAVIRIAPNDLKPMAPERLKLISRIVGLELVVIS